MRDPLDVGFTFERRPAPTPAALRPEWRIAILLLTLQQCWGSRASRRQLHVLNWAIRTPETRETFLHVITGALRPDEAVVRFDPVVDRALQFAAGESLVTISGDMVFLTENGEQFVKRINKDKECMAEEKSFLAAIGKKLTQVQVDAFFAMEGR
ncbi:MAG: hypothetical protein ACE14L_01075 [Terriglobales bacterium]